MPLHGEPFLAHLGKSQLASDHCAGQQARVSDIEYESRCRHRVACGLGLRFALRRKGNVMPPRKQIELIPGALAMAEKNQRSGHVLIVRRPRGYWGKGQMFSRID